MYPPMKRMTYPVAVLAHRMEVVLEAEVDLTMLGALAMAAALEMVTAAIKRV